MLKHLLLVVVTMGAMAAAAPVSSAQEHRHRLSPPSNDEHAGHAGAQEPAGHDHAAMVSPFAPREASGTAWQPDLTPMHAWHYRAGGWELMLHGQVFAQFIYERADVHRGSHQGGSINWGMGMARRAVGAGRLGVRAMVSVEPWTIPGCGYPDLLATGETCGGDTIHDRQHPHDLFMELSAEYDRPLAAGWRWQVYGGPAGEPALGPSGFPHRASARSNPIAPIGHHWLDATHITFGLVTTGVYSSRWKIEASAFNGREPDEDRMDIDLAALDSYSGRVSFSPRRSLTMQVSAGRLNDAEAGAGELPSIDVTRIAATATYHRALGADVWATTVGWGANREQAETSHAVLVETAATIRSAHAVFGRLEVGGKPAHSLHVHESADIFVVGKVQAGYARYARPVGGVQAGLGGSLSASLVPASLGPRYGARVNPGVAVFLTIRPAAHGM